MVSNPRCGRCGWRVSVHFDANGRPIGCPGGGPPYVQCQRAGCSAEATDLALSLCAAHVPAPIRRTKWIRGALS